MRHKQGTCENGEQIAVKVLMNMSGIDNKEFQKEFENLKRLKHQNVVELVGFCNEAEKVIVEHKGKQVVADKMHTALCFEFVCNGSLANHISGN
jgi:coatomer subunit beta'